MKTASQNHLPLIIGLAGGGFLLLLAVGAMVTMLVLWKGGGTAGNPVAAVGVPPELTPPPAPRVPVPPPPPKPVPPAVTPPGHHDFSCEYFSVSVKGEFGGLKDYKEPPPFPKSMLWYAPTPRYVQVRVSRVDAAFLADYQRDWVGALDRLLVREPEVITAVSTGTCTWSDCTVAGFAGRQRTFCFHDEPVARRSYSFTRYMVKGDLLYMVSPPGTLLGGVNNPDTDAVFDSFRVK